MGTEFVISASATGGKSMLGIEDYSCIKQFDMVQNSVQWTGLKPPSSESMSHAAVYHANESIKAVLHIHHVKAWEANFKLYPTTDATTEYGTPQMALEVAKLIESLNSSQGIIIMGGHREGILIYGGGFEGIEQLLKSLKV
jgi:hypothetical protein